ncbi:MAG: glycosyltransferase family 2 protein [Phenylobacterium sp.]|uniref:glycosyltransferase family 2 protein n=1 Tax=Phenylobacterium sp. TaxID=1871053 RepID=UPI00391B1CA0
MSSLYTDANRERLLNLRKALRASPIVHAPAHALAKALQVFPPVARLLHFTLATKGYATNDYAQWVADNDTLTAEDRAAIRAHVARLAHQPLISVVMPAYNTDEALLEAAIASVEAQLYPNWELCIADDASPKPHVWAALQKAAARNPKIKVVRRAQNGHISAATNSALELAAGEFVALMDHDDLLPEQALYEVVVELNAHPDADLIYSDEDKVDGEGRRFEPHFKTDWNPELFLTQNMISHLGVYRRSILEKIGGLRVGFEGSQDYDLALRTIEQTTPERIRHIPAVLYHWRQQAAEASFSEGFLDQCARAARQAVSEHLQRTGAEGVTVENQPELPAWLQVRRPLPDPAPMVSIIVPTRDRAKLLAACAEGVLHKTDYPNLELIIVDNGSVEPETEALFQTLVADPRVRLLRRPGPFNYSALNNAAAAEARGEILLLLNNDIEVIEGHWLAELVSQAVRPEIGAVGARLLYPDGTVQHGGVILGVGPHDGPRVAGHLHPSAAREDTGYYGHLRVARNCSAVTAACMALRKAVFDEVGGLDAVNLTVAFNDVDLCLRIREAGYGVVWTPHAELYHMESATRGTDVKPEAVARANREIAYMRERWGDVLDNDPFFGPNFDPRYGDYRLAPVSRRIKPWKRAEA